MAVHVRHDKLRRPQCLPYVRSTAVWRTCIVSAAASGSAAAKAATAGAERDNGLVIRRVAAEATAEMEPSDPDSGESFSLGDDELWVMRVNAREKQDE